MEQDIYVNFLDGKYNHSKAYLYFYLERLDNMNWFKRNPEIGVSVNYVQGNKIGSATFCKAAFRFIMQYEVISARRHEYELDHPDCWRSKHWVGAQMDHIQALSFMEEDLNEHFGQ